MDMYSHDDEFERFLDGEGTGTEVNIAMPFGETLAVNGHRQIPSIITISNKTERNPKRDARMLATVLTCALDEQTVFHLAEYLFAEQLAPMMSESRNLFSTLQPKSPKPKKKDPPKEQDENQN